MTRHVTRPRTKPLAGHRCKGPLFMVRVRCECGWESAAWCGKGAQGNAYGEWWMHIDKCRREGGGA